MTVGISGYVGFEDARDCLDTATLYCFGLPLAAIADSTDCTIAHGDFSVDTS